MTLPTSMAVILSAFESTDCLTYSEIKFTTNIDDFQLKQSLRTLVFGDYSNPTILKREQAQSINSNSEVSVNGDEQQLITEDDIFKLNHEFAPKITRLRITQ